MEAMRQSWSDDRLDHLNDLVDAGFARVDEKFEDVDRRFGEIDLKLVVIDHRLETLEGRLYALHRTVIQASFALIGTLIAGFAGVIASLN
jgi:hypothetical protein